MLNREPLRVTGEERTGYHILLSGWSCLKSCCRNPGEPEPDELEPEESFFRWPGAYSEAPGPVEFESFCISWPGVYPDAPDLLEEPDDPEELRLEPVLVPVLSRSSTNGAGP